MSEIVYPNGRLVSYDYGSGLNDSISRLEAMKDGSTTLEAYSYLGLGAVVERLHPESGVDLSYVKLSTESNRDAGDQYTGLDRFGRVVDQRWLSGTTDLDRYTYGYDRDGNRTYKDNVVNSALGEVYSYDGLNQLTGTTRGTLNSTKTGITGTASRAQSWTFDALGNWTAATTDSTTQTRSANQQNEITAISGATTPTYDASGNMITDESGKQFVYDAWGFLKVVKNSGGTVLETLSYDGLHRKTGIATTVTTDLYYSSSWQVLEERVGGVVKDSYVWSPVYVDALVARDRDADGNSGNGLEERIYVAQDANFNVTMLLSSAGVVRERITFDGYGMTQVRDAAWNVQTSSGYAWFYLHQGGRWDATSGLYSFRYREYSPTLGRWTRMDPIGYKGGTQALYESNNSNPGVMLDPTGLFSLNFGIEKIEVESADPKFTDVIRVDFDQSCTKDQKDRIKSALKSVMIGLYAVIDNLSVYISEMESKLTHKYRGGPDGSMNHDAFGLSIKEVFNAKQLQKTARDLYSKYSRLIERLQNGQLKIKCDSGNCKKGAIAYTSMSSGVISDVFAGPTGRINICKAFYDEEMDKNVNTILHELVHSVFLVTDKGYIKDMTFIVPAYSDPNDLKTPVNLDPDQLINNPDTLVYFIRSLKLFPDMK